jgi:ABC-2 type transport system permease protein
MDEAGAKTMSRVVAIEQWRSFRVAAWLGWQIESNWASPLLFAVYAVAKPLAMAGILVAIYATATSGNFGAPMFTYIYLGNAFYLYVGAVMTGMAYAVVDDRERYLMLRSVYTAPVDIRCYLAGRGVARFVTASVAVLITIMTGVLFLHVHVSLGAVDWPLLAVSLAIGIAMLAMLGLMLAGAMLLLGHMSWAVGDAVAGSLYLFSGAVFPLEALPPVLRPIGLLLPITCWLELMRRSVVGPAAEAFPTFAALSDRQVLGILFVQTLASAAIAIKLFGRCDAAARERGLIDRTTNY